MKEPPRVIRVLPRVTAHRLLALRDGSEYLCLAAALCLAVELITRVAVLGGLILVALAATVLRVTRELRAEMLCGDGRSGRRQRLAVLVVGSSAALAVSVLITLRVGRGVVLFASGLPHPLRLLPLAFAGLASLRVALASVGLLRGRDGDAG
jgi:hypothetical protein